MFISEVRLNHLRNLKADQDLKKEREAIKKDLQKKLDIRWDKDLHDRSRYKSIFTNINKLYYYSFF